jgi:hypothetical protein
MAKRINTQPQRRSQLQYAHITGWGMALPEQVLTNDDMAAIVDTNDEWIHSRTGIRQRYIANDKETTASLGLMAAKKHWRRRIHYRMRYNSLSLPLLRRRIFSPALPV